MCTYIGNLSFIHLIQNNLRLLSYVILRLCEIIYYLCGFSCVSSVKTAGQTLCHKLHMAVRTFERGVPCYLFHQHWLQIVVAWQVPSMTWINPMDHLE